MEAPVVTAPLQGESAAPAADATAEASTSVATSTSASKKDKKRDRKKERETKNAVSSDAAAKVFPAVETTAPANLEAVTVAAEPETATTDAEKTPAATTPTPDQPTRAAPPVSEEQPTAGAPPIATQEGGLRLRMKVWTDPETLKRYLVATAFMRDMVNGHPVSDIMRAYAMSEEDTRVITLRVAEWNTLPFYYFQEDGIAPRASRRPVDRIG
jgi:hypothetical protein